jgi:soluble lytic murein transglycosylase
LQVHGSRFLRIEILLALLAVPLLTASCGPRQVWGVPVEDLRGQLAKGTYTSLVSVDFSAQDPRDALSLSPEAPYYLSFVFTAMDKPAQSQRMLELAWDRSPSPWKEEAGVLLAEAENEQKEYGKAIEISRRLLAANAPLDLQQRARRALVEALYWSKDDAAALAEAERLASPDPEVLLFRAVSSLRLGLPEAHALMLRLFTSERVSALHGRAYTFLAAEPAFLQLFSAREQDLLSAKNALVQGDWAAGIPLMETVLGGMDPAQLSDGALIVDLGSSYGYAGRQAAGAKFLEKLAARLAGPARTDALEQAGRLYRRLKDVPRALPLLRAAAAEAAAPLQRDRVRWLILDMLVSANPPGLTRQIGEETASWNDPGYFSDRLESWIAELVIARKWDTIAGLWAALAESGPDEVRAQLSYLLARAWQEGEIVRLPGEPRSTARDLFLDAARRDESGYYGILSASILGQVPDRSIPAAAAVQEPVGQQPAARIAPDPVVMGFLPYGLFSLAYSRLWAMRDGLSDDQLIDAARRFAQAGDTRSSMYLVGAVGRRRRLTESELELYYPKAFSDLIDPLASRARIPDHILYALVREESYFDADIVSSAGAVGLSQLMPSTAAGVAKGLQMNDPDLRDPATNLAIGVRHLQDLLSSVDSPTKALLSYNAGMKRLRQWERSARGFPVDLFVETVPIAETRGYVRKILVSAVMYASLYADADPREAALSFLNIEKKSLDTAGPRGPQTR